MGRPLLILSFSSPSFLKGTRPNFHSAAGLCPAVSPLLKKRTLRGSFFQYFFRNSGDGQTGRKPSDFKGLAAFVFPETPTKIPFFYLYYNLHLAFRGTYVV